MANISYVGNELGRTPFKIGYDKGNYRIKNALVWQPHFWLTERLGAKWQTLEPNLITETKEYTSPDETDIVFVSPNRESLIKEEKEARKRFSSRIGLVIGNIAAVSQLPFYLPLYIIENIPMYYNIWRRKRRELES